MLYCSIFERYVLILIFMKKIKDQDNLNVLRKINRDKKISKENLRTN